MPSKRSKVPDGWDGVSNIGEQVPGTPFICFKTPLKPSFGRWPHCHSNPIIKFLINALSCAVYDKRKIFRNWGIEDLVNACPELAMIIDLTHTDRCLLFLHQNPGRPSLSITIGVDDSLNICHFYQVLILISSGTTLQLMFSNKISAMSSSKLAEEGRFIYYMLNI